MSFGMAPADLEAMRASVYRWAFRMLRNREDALDATQNVLLRALSAGGSGIERLPAWLRRVTVNHCIDVLRSRRPVVGELERATSADPAAEERRRRVADALAGLTAPQRAVVIAKVYDGETFAEIAAALGTSASTAKTHWLRALRRLRDRLGPAEGIVP